MAEDYRAAARRAAVRAGIDPNIFVRQIQQESGFNPNARSPAGATGIAQIMPATARGWGVDPSDPIASLNAAASNMASYVKKYGGYENALRAYNAGPGAIQRSKGFAETNNYVKTILGGQNPKPLTKATEAAVMGTSSSSPIQTAVASEANYAPITLPERPKVQMAKLSAPSHTAQVTGAEKADTALALHKAVIGKDSERLTSQSALRAITALEGALRPNQTVQFQTQDNDPQGDQAGEEMQTGGSGKFKIEGPDPDRLKPALVGFARRVADIFGGTLEGKDGSSHSKMTVNGNVSQHYTGNATDIFSINGKPATGDRLIAAGRAALIAAGMPRSKAMKAPGGLYNVGGHQIIFGVDGKQYGGNHLDHLHISAR